MNREEFNDIISNDKLVKQIAAAMDKPTYGLGSEPGYIVDQARDIANSEFYNDFCEVAGI